MGVVRDKLEGPVTIKDQVTLVGMITGNTTVVAGGRLLLNGMCAGDVVVETGGEVQLRGMVVGNVYNRGGTVVVVGMVCGFLAREAGATSVDPKGVIVGGVR